MYSPPLSDGSTHHPTALPSPPPHSHPKQLVVDRLHSVLASQNLKTRKKEIKKTISKTVFNFSILLLLLFSSLQMFLLLQLKFEKKKASFEIETK